MKTKEEIEKLSIDYVLSLSVQENIGRKTVQRAFVYAYSEAQAYHEDKTRWISVEERLPEVDNKDNPFGERIDCLVVYEGYVYKGQYMNIGEPFWSVSHICTSSSLDVTKWMLLPKP